MLRSKLGERSVVSMLRRVEEGTVVGRPAGRLGPTCKRVLMNSCPVKRPVLQTAPRTPPDNDILTRAAVLAKLCAEISGIGRVMVPMPPNAVL